MKGVIVVLQGPLRSWGEQSLGDNRATELYPTASALVGFLGACAGVDRHDDEDLDSWYGAWDCLSITAHRYDTDSPVQMNDFQTARNSLNTSGGTVKDAVISYRGYLQETIDAAVLLLRSHADPELYERAIMGMRNPVFTPYLGRINNPLSHLPWLPNEEIAVSADIDTLADIAIERLRNARRLINQQEGDACHLALNAQLIAPSGMLSKRADRKFRFRTSIADRRLGAPLSYGRRMVDVFEIQRGCDNA